MVRQYQRGRARRARWFCRKALKIDRRLAVGFLGLTPASRARVVVAADAVSKKGRGCAAGGVEGLCFKGQGKGSEGVVAAPRQYLASFLWKAEALQRASEPGSCVSIACTLSEHLNARPSVARLGDGGTVSVLFSNFRCSSGLRPAPF